MLLVPDGAKKSIQTEILNLVLAGISVQSGNIVVLETVPDGPGVVQDAWPRIAKH